MRRLLALLPARNSSTFTLKDSVKSLTSITRREDWRTSRRKRQQVERNQLVSAIQVPLHVPANQARAAVQNVPKAMSRPCLAPTKQIAYVAARRRSVHVPQNIAHVLRVLSQMFRKSMQLQRPSVHVEVMKGNVAVPRGNVPAQTVRSSV